MDQANEATIRALSSRRGLLIDRKFAGTLTPEEAQELAQLTAAVDAYLREVWAPDLAWLQQLLEALRAREPAPGRCRQG